MKELLTIREASGRTELSTHTLRYYERIGLLTPVERATSGHRRYSGADLRWIEFLNRLRATGMPIREMRKFAALRRAGDASVAERRVLLEQHQRDVAERIGALQENLAAISEKIAQYRELEQKTRATTRRRTA